MLCLDELNRFNLGSSVCSNFIWLPNNVTLGLFSVQISLVLTDDLTIGPIKYKSNATMHTIKNFLFILP